MDVEETIGIEEADVAGFEPAVGCQDFVAAFGVAEITGENVRTFQDNDTGLIERHGCVGDGIGEADGDAGQELTNRAVETGRQGM